MTDTTRALPHHKYPRTKSAEDTRMSDKTCECGHPKHSIPCPDTSEDDGEGHVTICGCHRLVGDKLPALPPRPHFPCIRRKGLWWLDETSVYDYMDAQDASIKELESDAILRRSLMSSLIVQRDKQDEHIAELDREIREAHELIDSLISGQSADLREIQAKRWLARNAEKKQAS